MWTISTPAMPKRSAGQQRSQAVVPQYAVPVFLYLLLTIFTGSKYMADTVDYVATITKRVQGVWAPRFWDFGHVLWRPLGWLLYRSVYPFEPRADARAALLWIFVTTSWLAGLVCIVTLVAMLRRLFTSTASIFLTAAMFVLSQAFLNFSRAGTSYIPGLCALMIGCYLLWQPDNASRAAPVCAGCALSAAVGLWFPYALAVPGVLIGPLILFRDRTKVFFKSGAVFALATGLIYGAVVLHLRLHNIRDFLNWVAASEWAIGAGGPKRVIFGVARSFVSLGNAGVFFKRLLLHDPYNPVVPTQFLASVLKLIFVYVFLGVVIVQLIRSRVERVYLILLASNLAAVGLFAVLWYGADMERFLPLFPALFVAICAALESSGRRQKALTVAFIAMIATVNIAVMAKSTLRHKQQAVLNRIAPLLPRLNTNSRIVVLDGDGLAAFIRNFPFHSLSRNNNVHPYTAVVPDTSQVPHWRQGFSALVLEVWNQQGSMWISKRMLNPRPLAGWNWVQGDDPRVRWADIYNFFRQFEFGNSVGGADGFVLLLPTEHNRLLLARLVRLTVRSRVIPNSCLDLSRAYGLP